MGAEARIEVAPPQQNREATFFAPGVTSIFVCAPIVLLNDATFLQMTRLLQVTKITRIHFCVRPQTDSIRLVSSKLVLWAGSRRLGRQS